MKKYALVIGVSLSLLLVSCGQEPQKTVKNTQPTADEETVVPSLTEDTTTPPASEATDQKTTPVEKQPSFDDGQIYLKAIGAHDVKLCAKISDTSLKSRCQKDAAAK